MLVVEGKRRGQGCGRARKDEMAEGKRTQPHFRVEKALTV